MYNVRCSVRALYNMDEQDVREGRVWIYYIGYRRSSASDLKVKLPVTMFEEKKNHAAMNITTLKNDLISSTRFFIPFILRNTWFFGHSVSRIS